MRAHRRIAPAVGLLIALAIAAACKKGPPPPEPVDPVTMDEARTLADAFGKAMKPCEASALAPLLDGRSILRRAVQVSTAPARLKREIGAATDNTAVAPILCQGMGQVASYKLLRIREVDGQPRPLFRLITDGDGAMNYHELILGKSRKDHVVRVVDVLVYASGDRISDSIAQMLDQLAVVADEGGNGAAIQRSLEAVKRAQAEGDSVAVRERLAELPRAVRNSKPMRLVEVSSAELEDPAYLDLMEKYKQDFPDDPSLDMVLVDYYYTKKDIPQTLAVVDRIDAKVGGDPYLGVMRASAHMIDPTPEHLAEAEKWARKATVDEPDLELAWWTLVGVLLTRGDHAAVLPVAETLKTKFGATIDPDAMAGNELWQAHFASAAYRAAHAER